MVALLDHKPKQKKARVEAPTRLDLGCGQNKREGFFGIDSIKTAATDWVQDLREPWCWRLLDPIPDNSIEEVHSSHFFEHLTGPERMPFMDEMWRVMKDEAQATIIVPYYASMRAVQDPTHAWPPVCETSFLYFNRQWREQNGLDHYPLKCNFDFAYGYAMDGAWSLKSQEVRDFAVRQYINVVADLHVTLTKRA